MDKEHAKAQSLIIDHEVKKVVARLLKQYDDDPIMHRHIAKVVLSKACTVLGLMSSRFGDDDHGSAEHVIDAFRTILACAQVQFPMIDLDPDNTQAFAKPQTLSGTDTTPNAPTPSDN